MAGIANQEKHAANRINMHELSIIQSIVELSEAAVKQAGASKVDSIELVIGELAGVEWQALDFAWEVGIQNSVLQYAERQIDKISGLAQCLECGTSFHLNAIYDPCPDCGSYFHEIKAGKELKVKALTVS